MQPMFIATEKFQKSDGDAWIKYIQWSGLTQLEEVVSLDSMLCPYMLSEVKDEYWPHLVEELYFPNLFADLEYLMGLVPETNQFNLLRVFKNPSSNIVLTKEKFEFEFLGYDLIEVEGSMSALTNCGGFPKAFNNGELTRHGLLPSQLRAVEVQLELRKQYPEEHHADCNVWGIARAKYPFENRK